MKRIALLVGLASIVGTASAQETYGDRSRAHFFLDADYYAVGNAAANAANDVAAVQALLIASYGSVSSDGGRGGRAGFLYDVNDYFSGGLSAGYVYGPTITKTVSGLACVGLSCGAVNASGHIYASAWRIMAEARPTLPLNNDWKVILGLGAGVAFMHIDEDALVSAPGYSSGSSGFANFSGLTYELSPMISCNGLGVGARFASFPSFGGGNGVESFKWQTWGGFLEYQFGTARNLKRPQNLDTSSSPTLDGNKPPSNSSALQKAPSGAVAEPTGNVAPSVTAPPPYKRDPQYW
jgi:hypothetical protein